METQVEFEPGKDRPRCSLLITQKPPKKYAYARRSRLLCLLFLLVLILLGISATLGFHLYTRKPEKKKVSEFIFSSISWQSAFRNFNFADELQKIQGMRGVIKIADDTKLLYRKVLADPKLLNWTLSRRQQLYERTLHGSALPANFSSLEMWGEKCPSLGRVYNQGTCGSCWAVAAASVMSDRTCVMSKSNRQVEVSADSIIRCCKHCGGCSGSIEFTAFNMWCTEGIVTGGGYGSNDGCEPYSFPNIPCGIGKPCSISLYQAQKFKCEKTCQDSYQIPYDQDKSYGDSYYALLYTHEAGNGSMFQHLRTAVANITTLNATNSILMDTEIVKHEIFERGPVIASTYAFIDLISYSYGIYDLTTSHRLYGHTFKIDGWGIANGVPFWKCVNVWGRDWGMDGRFNLGMYTIDGNHILDIAAGAVPRLSPEDRYDIDDRS